VFYELYVGADLSAIASWHRRFVGFSPLKRLPQPEVLRELCFVGAMLYVGADLSAIASWHRRFVGFSPLKRLPQ
jgi:hypothetical protein